MWPLVSRRGRATASAPVVKALIHGHPRSPPLQHACISMSPTVAAKPSRRHVRILLDRGYQNEGRANERGHPHPCRVLHARFLADPCQPRNGCRLPLAPLQAAVSVLLTSLQSPPLAAAYAPMLQTRMGKDVTPPPSRTRCPVVTDPLMVRDLRIRCASETRTSAYPRAQKKSSV
jgi:hypothetical protein